METAFILIIVNFRKLFLLKKAVVTDR